MKVPVTQPDPYMDINDLEAYSRINKRTLRELVKEMPHFRFRRKLLVKKSVFDAEMRKHVNNPHPLVEEIVARLRAQG